MGKLFSVSAGLLLLTAFAAIFITCTKGYNPAGRYIIPIAVYNLTGAPTACASRMVAGNYNAGTALNAGDTVTLQVNVVVAGTYTISTGTINGMQFSTAGNFAKTGLQTVTLSGSGTPAGSGSFSFKTLTDSGCSFIVAVNNAYIKRASYTLAGAPSACTNFILNGDFIYGDSLVDSSTVSVNVNVTAPGPYALTTDTLDGISFSASGTFGNTGIQQVTLIGHGTPGDAQTLNFKLAGDSTACGFTLTVVNPQPPATYVLASNSGSPNPCIYSVTGNYFANTPLSKTNNVSLIVRVTVVGSFTISTGVVNGMLFSHTGTFIATGQQNVILTGSGTPVAPGTYGLTPQIVGPHPLGGQACAISIVVN